MLPTGLNEGISEQRPMFRLEERIELDNILRRVSGCEHPKDMLDSNAPATNNRLAAEDGRIGLYSIQQLLLVHGLIAVCFFLVGAE